MAAAGYLVLYVNPRGSTSYKESFAMRIHHTVRGRAIRQTGLSCELLSTDCCLTSGY
jgi:dipeptidyl aminopeptidase/acylaminoacyl peptidase